MDRRDFLKAAAGASALVLIPGMSSAKEAPMPVSSEPLVKGAKTKVFLAGTQKGVAPQELKNAVVAAALAATDFSWLAKGDTVFIKPVINSAHVYPATTNPLAVAAMVELLKLKGAARVIVGDMSGVQTVRFSAKGLSGSTRKTMAAIGFSQIVEGAGAEIYCFEEAGWQTFYEDMPRAGKNWKKPLLMPNILKDVQHIILMPRTGRHVLSGSTLGMKAAVGYWRHDTRLEFHRDAASFQEKIAESNTVATLLSKQRLVLTAADKLMTSIGPDNGYIHKPQTGLIIASDSVVAHDMVSLAWLLADRKEIPDAERDVFLDNAQIVSRLSNRVIVNWLGGIGDAITSEPLHKGHIGSIWDDRTLTHAYRIFGGVPQISLEKANQGIPDKLTKLIAEMTALAQG